MRESRTRADELSARALAHDEVDFETALVSAILSVSERLASLEELLVEGLDNIRESVDDGSTWIREALEPPE